MEQKTFINELIFTEMVNAAIGHHLNRSGHLTLDQKQKLLEQIIVDYGEEIKLQSDEPELKRPDDYLY